MACVGRHVALGVGTLEQCERPDVGYHALFLSGGAASLVECVDQCV